MLHACNGVNVQFSIDFNQICTHLVAIEHGDPNNFNGDYWKIPDALVSKKQKFVGIIHSQVANATNPYPYENAITLAKGIL